MFLRRLSALTAKNISFCQKVEGDIVMYSAAIVTYITPPDVVQVCYLISFFPAFRNSSAAPIIPDKAAEAFNG